MRVARKGVKGGFSVARERTSYYTNMFEESECNFGRLQSLIFLSLALQQLFSSSEK